MITKQITETLEKQKDFFNNGSTLSVEVRKSFLRKLKEAIKNNQDAIVEALHQDLGIGEFQSYMTQIGMIFDEINYMLRHLKRFAQKQTVYTPIAQQPAKSYVVPQPFGNVLIISPWNYPFLLTFDPLVDALAAGNTAVLKLSPYSPHSSEVITKIVKEVFPEEYVSVFEGHREVTQALLHQPFNFIFYTGSTRVGKEVMKAASENLTPVALELGGKSPCIVDGTADLEVAARRIVFGKFLNSGQTCVAPDFICAEKSIKDDLIEKLKHEIVVQYSDHPLENKDYGKIINEQHFRRLLGLLDEEKIVFGGKYNEETLQIEPTIMDGVDMNDPVMGEEIFGPILPVMTYSEFEDLIPILQDRPDPLALYLFTRDPEHVDLVEERLRYGGGCINDTVVQLATSHMGFGGIGASGMGAYHGKTGFDCFTHYKSMLKRSDFPANPVRYMPYNAVKNALLKVFLK